MAADTLKCRVDFSWDKDASVWIATSKDIEGLVLESGSFDALVERVRFAIPELLELYELADLDHDLTAMHRLGILDDKTMQTTADGSAQANVSKNATMAV